MLFWSFTRSGAITTRIYQDLSPSLKASVNRGVSYLLFRQAQSSVGFGGEAL